MKGQGAPVEQNMESRPCRATHRCTPHNGSADAMIKRLCRLRVSEFEPRCAAHARRACQQ